MDNKGRRANNGRKMGGVSSQQGSDYKGREHRGVRVRRKTHREKPKGALDSFSL